MFITIGLICVIVCIPLTFLSFVLAVVEKQYLTPLIMVVIVLICSNIAQYIFNNEEKMIHNAGQYVLEKGTIKWYWNDELGKMKAEKEKNDEQ